MNRRSKNSPAGSKPNPLKGLYHVHAKERDYYYAWRGGPRVEGTYGSPEFLARFVALHEEHRTPDKTRFHSVIVAYKASTAYSDLAETTRKQWGTWLDRIAEDFGDLRIQSFEHTKPIKKAISKWRAARAPTPRTADYGMQVLSRILSFAVDNGDLTSNPCVGFKPLYSTDRSEIIWTEADIRQIKASASEEIGWAIDLAAHTGLRLGDLVRVAWSHVGENLIELPTGKSRGRKSAIVPLYDDLRDVLARIKRRSPIILTNERDQAPWTRSGLSGMVGSAKDDAKMGDRDLHFHDLRGTAATKFYLAGLAIREIAEIMAWEEDQVERIIRRYVGREAKTKALIKKLNRSKRRTRTAKPGEKPA